MTITLAVGQQIKKLSQSRNILGMFLLFGDIIGLLFSFSLSISWKLAENEDFNSFEPLTCIVFVLIILGLYLADTYQPDTQIAGLRAPYRIVISNFVIGSMITALIYFPGLWTIDPLWKRGILIPCIGLFTIWAIVVRMWATKWSKAKAEHSRWLILGATKKAILFGKTFLNRNSFGRLILLATPEQNTDELVDNHRVSIGHLDDFWQWSQQSWSGVIVAAELSEIQMPQLINLRLSGVSVYTIPDICETLWHKLPSSLLQDNWLAVTAGFNLATDRISQRLKRLFDIIVALLLLLCLSPLMLLVAIAIKLDSPGHIFYSQVRTGLEGKSFRVHKFRSMYQDAEKRGAQWAGERDPRITRVGGILRRTRIDELPQIFNVILGEMSLIGPRPERPEFDTKLRQTIPYYDLRYVIKPGITGWAQVMYPYGASVEDAYEKLAYDLYYIKNYSLTLDLAIFFKTIRVVLLGKGR